MGESAPSLYAGRASENRYQLGSEPRPVLLADVRSAARDGFSLATDPTTVLLAGSRCIYDAEPALGAPRLVAVLAASTRWSPWLAQRIHAALRDDRRMVRKADIVTLKEAAARVRCSEKHIHSLKALPAFPKPFKKSPPLYDWKEIRAFLDERERYRNKKTGVMPPGR